MTFHVLYNCNIFVQCFVRAETQMHVRRNYKGLLLTYQNTLLVDSTGNILLLDGPYSKHMVDGTYNEHMVDGTCNAQIAGGACNMLLVDGTVPAIC